MGNGAGEVGRAKNSAAVSEGKGANPTTEVGRDQQVLSSPKICDKKTTAQKGTEDEEVLLPRNEHWRDYEKRESGHWYKKTHAAGRFKHGEKHGK